MSPVELEEGRSMDHSISAVVLAAGMSRRMGTNKLLLSLRRGTVLTHILSVLQTCPLSETVVVTGHEREKVEKAIAECGFLEIVMAHNPNYASGEMLSSIQAGLSALRPDRHAALIVLGDQPLLDRRVVERILAAHAPGRMVIPSYHRKGGHPILIDRACWPAVLGLPHEGSLRDLLRRKREWVSYIEVDTDAILHDMDTPEDYRRAITNP